MKNLEIGAVYKHYKRTKAKVLAEGFHSETLEPMVIYLHLEDGVVWVRPKEMFLGNVMIDGKEVERFQKIEQPARNASGIADASGEILIKPKNKKL